MVGTIKVFHCNIVDVKKFETFFKHIYFMDPYLNRNLKQNIYIKFIDGNHIRYIFFIYYGTLIFLK